MKNSRARFNKLATPYSSPPTATAAFGPLGEDFAEQGVVFVLVDVVNTHVSAHVDIWSGHGFACINDDVQSVTDL